MNLRSALSLICILLFIIPFSCKPQAPAEKRYTDMIIKGDRLYALTASGHINIFDTGTNKIINTNIHTDTPIIAMTTDRQGDIIVADKRQRISNFNTVMLSFKNTAHTDKYIYQTVFDSKNEMYIVTSKGILEAKQGKLYYPDTSMSLNHQFKGWMRPSAIFIDKQERIWVGSNEGEWGGNLFVFDTRTAHFVKPKMNGFDLELNPVNTIFEIGNDIGITFSLAHMMTSSAIVKFENLSAKPLIQSKTGWKDTVEMVKIAGRKGGPKLTAMKISVDGEYIGPATYNPADSCIYFYSQNGIFKGNINRDLSQISKWTKVASPKLIWTAGQVNAVGPANNMLKIALGPNGKLYFVSQSNGIGMIDRGKVVMLE